MGQENVVLLKVQLDEAGTEKKLQQLVLDIEATKKAQAALTAERKVGAVSDADFAKRSVDLQTQLKGQRNETTALTKNLELYRAAQNGEADSYKATQAALSLAIRQQQELAGSASNSSEASQALTKQIEQYRATLKSTDEQQGSFFRSIGNYPKGESLAPLVAQLVKLEEAQKSGILTTEQAAKTDAEIIGFKQRIAQAGATEGKSYQETTDFVKEYGAAIRPATAELVKLEQEQRQVVESGKATDEQISQLGFRFGKAQKDIKEATEALKEVPPAAEGAEDSAKGLGAGLLDAAKGSDVLGGAVDVLSSAKEKYTVAANLAKAATAGEVGVLGALKLALIATGLGLFAVVLGSVVAFLTKTQAGTDFLSRRMAALGAVAWVVTNLFIDFGGKTVEAAQNPKQAFADLVDFLESQVINRLKAFGVIVDAIKNGNVKGIVNGFLQLNTGVEDVIGKVQTLGVEMATAATSAQQIERETQRIREAERALNVERDESRAKIEGLKKLSDDSTKSVSVRTAAAREAAAIENGLLAEQTKLQDAKIRNLQAAQLLQKNLTTEDKDALADLRRERAQTAQESLTLQTELQNKINSLNQERIDQSIAGRAQALALEAAMLNKQLAQVKQNTDEELSLRQRLLLNGKQAELNVKNLTVKQKKIIDLKYENDSLAHSLDFNRRKLQAALQAANDATAAQLAQQQAGSEEALRLQAEQIEQQRQLSLAGLAANADNTAKIDAINAQAAKQQRELEFADATRQLAEYIEHKRQLVERDYATGVIQEAEYQRRLEAIAKSSTDAQAVINSDYRQSNTENAKQAAQNEIEAARRHTAEVKQTEQAKQQIREATVQSFAAGTDAIIQLFGEESGAGQAALALKKILGLAEVSINLQKTLSLNAVAAAELAAIPLIGPALGAAYLATNNALAIAQAAVGAATILSLEQGGIAVGPSHKDGGIPLYHQGRPAGIEIEGGEPVLTKGVTQNPLLLSLASTVNQLAGGRALVPSFSVPRMAAGGVAQALTFGQVRGDAPVIDYERMGAATAQALRKSPPRAIISDVQAGLDRDSFTQKQSNA
jgi:hypothetical protein